MDVKDHLKTLCQLPGLSAYETPVSDYLKTFWQPYVQEFSGDKIGSLWGIRPGSGPEPRKRILLSGHMDAIGLMVTQIRDGFLRFTEIGGIDVRVLPGTLVQVHPTYGAGPTDPIPGVVASIPPHLQPRNGGSTEAPDLSEQWIDLGLPPEEVAARVHLGDLVTFAYPPFDLGSDWVVSKSMDNRVAVAVISYCLHLLSTRTHQWDVIAAATVQEEEVLGGAFASGFAAYPDLAIAIDVTWARQPGTENWETFKLGAGPTLMWGPNLHPKLHTALMDVAKANEIPVHKELTPRHAGTDAYALQVAREGIPTAGVGIALKNMHTPVETVSIKDIKRAGRLLAEFICTLTDDTLPKLDLDRPDEPKADNNNNSAANNHNEDED